jgi:hypothetical protein
LDRRGCEKGFFSTEYILVNKWSTRFKKGAVELSVWIEEDLKKNFLFSRIYFGQQLLASC